MLSLHSSEEEQQRLIEKFQKHIAHFFEAHKICCVQNLKVDLFLKDSESSKPVASQKEDCVIQEEEQVFCVYIDSNIRLPFISKIHKCITDMLALYLINDFKEEDFVTLKEFIERLLCAQRPEEIYSMLQEKEISFNEMDITLREPQQFMPQKNEDEAKRWVRQAIADHYALQVLLKEAETNLCLLCHVCFMAHEVAEKALKGAMLATCGLQNKQRSNHNIVPLACAVEQTEPEKARGLSTLAEPLKSTYKDETRFPKEESASTPYERFTQGTAMEAERCATRILEIVRDIVVVVM